MIKYLTYRPGSGAALLVMLEAHNITILNHLENLRVVVVLSTPDVMLDLFDGVVGVYDEDTMHITPESETWHLRRLSTTLLPLPTEIRRTNLGEGSTVYVIDGSLPDILPPELSGQSIQTIFTVGEPSPDVVHAESVVSLIVGKTIGVAPAATVRHIAVPFYSELSLIDLLGAFEAILTDPARPAFSVVNCSWSIPKNRLLDQKITELMEHNVYVVAAAGNIGVDVDTISPAGLDSTLSVGATDAFDRVMPWEVGENGEWSQRSNVGADIYAPGIDVPVSRNGILTYGSGTSLAAAIVTGVVAQHITAGVSNIADMDNTILSEAVRDVLYSDDLSVLADNLLVQHARVRHDLLWDVPDKILVTAGEQLTVDIGFTEPIAQVVYTPIRNGFSEVIPFDWVAVSGNTLTIHPPSDYLSSVYVVVLTGLDTQGTVVSRHWLRIGVASPDVPDPFSLSSEYYMAQDVNTGVVSITPYENCCTTGCPKGFFCCQENVGGEFNPTCVSSLSGVCC